MYVMTIHTYILEHVELPDLFRSSLLLFLTFSVLLLVANLNPIKLLDTVVIPACMWSTWYSTGGKYGKEKVWQRTPFNMKKKQCNKKAQGAYNKEKQEQKIDGQKGTK